MAGSIWRRRPRVLRHRAGFTLIEMIAVMAIIVAIGAVLVPNAIRRVHDARAAAMATDMDAFKDAIIGYRGNVGRYPSRLSDLATTPEIGDDDACLIDLPTQNINLWRGPYLDREILSSGLKVGDATIQDALVRVPTDASVLQFGHLLVRAVDVDRGTADRLEKEFDGNADFTAGTIRWTDLGNDRGQLDFAIPIKGC